jgi:hypothetical protein
MKNLTTPRFDFGFHILSAAAAIFLVVLLNRGERVLWIVIVTAYLACTTSISCWQFYRRNRRQIATNSWHSDGGPK